MATKNGKQRKVSNSVRCWLDYNQVDRPLVYFELPEDADNRQKKCALLMRQVLYMALMASADPDGTGITVGLERLSRKISRSLRTTKDLNADLKRLGLVTEHGRESGHDGHGHKIRHVHSLRASLFARQLISWGGEVRLIVTGGQRHSAVVSGGQFVAEANGGLGEWIPEVQSSGIYNKAEVQSSPIEAANVPDDVHDEIGAEVQGSHAEVQGSHAEVQPSQGRGWHRQYRSDREDIQTTPTHNLTKPDLVRNEPTITPDTASDQPVHQEESARPSLERRFQKEGSLTAEDVPRLTVGLAFGLNDTGGSYLTWGNDQRLFWAFTGLLYDHRLTKKEYRYGIELYSACLEAISRHASEPFLGLRTCAMLCGEAMDSMERIGTDWPKSWAIVLKQLRAAARKETEGERLFFVLDFCDRVGIHVRTDGSFYMRRTIPDFSHPDRSEHRERLQSPVGPVPEMPGSKEFTKARLAKKRERDSARAAGKLLDGHHPDCSVQRGGDCDCVYGHQGDSLLAGASKRNLATHHVQCPAQHGGECDCYASATVNPY